MQCHLRFVTKLIVIMTVVLSCKVSGSFWLSNWSQLIDVFRFLQESILETRMVLARQRPEITFICRNANENDTFEVDGNDNSNLMQLNSSYPLGFFLHGWKDHGRNNWVIELQDEWLKYSNTSVCIVNWGTLSLNDYKSAMLSIFDVGLTLANFIELLTNDYGYNPTNMTIAGYSLGAHAAGYAGQILQGQLGQIIGLDPAGPLFTIPADVGIKYRLDSTDAEFVQVIHTSSGTLGTHVKSGHADFYPNGGMPPQTNCIMAPASEETNLNPVGCSHSSVIKFFKHSMNPEYPFTGYECASYQQYVFGMCRKNRKSHFGVHSERQSGNFFFTTSVIAPYVERKILTNNDLEN